MMKQNLGCCVLSDCFCTTVRHVEVINKKPVRLNKCFLLSFFRVSLKPKQFTIVILYLFFDCFDCKPTSFGRKERLFDRKYIMGSIARKRAAAKNSKKKKKSQGVKKSTVTQTKKDKVDLAIGQGTLSALVKNNEKVVAAVKPKHKKEKRVKSMGKNGWKIPNPPGSKQSPKEHRQSKSKKTRLQQRTLDKE